MKTEVLVVDRVSKKFSSTLRTSAWNGLKDVGRDLLFPRHSRDHLRGGEFWALQDVSFTVVRGEAVGIVGSNGSGKSTLLRLISGIYPPDRGRIEVHGRVGALISLGAGFNPHMSGRENIYLNGSLLGMKREEIRRKLESIIEFAEIGSFIDSPVSTYSSGMTVRLGFAIASHAEPELLIVDEIMAVGDLAFSIKCNRKMSDFRRAGGTTLLVSHSNQLIRNICTRAIWLDKGQPRGSGSADEICALYEESLLSGISIGSDAAQHLAFDSSIELFDVRINGRAQSEWTTFDTRESLSLSFRLKSSRNLGRILASVLFENMHGVIAHCSFSYEDGMTIEKLEAGTHEFRIDFKELNLKTDAYYMSFTIAEFEVANVLLWHQRAYSFKVFGGKANQGLVDLKPKWFIS